MKEPSSHQQAVSSFQEREYQDAHYHDEEPEIQNDDLPRPSARNAARRKPRIPQPKRRYYEE
jgi:hypothetical protein